MSKLLSSVRVVLSRPETPGNIGAVARAMKNMGMTKLSLVSPQCAISDEARIRSVHALDVLESATIHNSLHDAIKEAQQAYAFSVRTRHSPILELDARKTGVDAIQRLKNHPDAEIALVFGNERSGLLSEEVSLCHARSFIPTSEYSSLNLAQAVQVAVYELFSANQSMETSQAQQSPSTPLHEDGKDEKDVQWNQWGFVPAKLESVELIAQNIDALMQEMSFYTERHSKRELAKARLQRIFRHANMSQGESDLLLGFFRLLKRRLGEDKKNTD